MIPHEQYWDCPHLLGYFGLLDSSLAHSRMEHYFFSYLLICEAYLMEVLEIMAQMLQYITFLSLKSIKVSSDFILNYLKKVIGGATT